MRSSCLLLCLLAFSATALESAHPVGIEFWAGHMEFHEDIRFEGDTVLELGVSYGFVEWLELKVALSQMRMWDRNREVWGQSAGFSMHWNLWPRAFERFGLGAVAGVSFMGLEEDENSDSIAEGLDLGLAWRRGIGSDWSMSAELFGRLQSFNVVEVDGDGTPLGTREDTGYLWSPLIRVGVGHAF